MGAPPPGVCDPLSSLTLLACVTKNLIMYARCVCNEVSEGRAAAGAVAAEEF